MVQEFNVVRCFSCETYQVDQVKKSTNKWNCKICHEKQSVKQVFFRGTAKECRVHVQSLNLKKASNQLLNQDTVLNPQIQGALPHGERKHHLTTLNTESQKCIEETIKSGRICENRWEQFIEKEDNEMNPCDNNITTERNLFEATRKMQQKKHSIARRNDTKPYQLNGERSPLNNTRKQKVDSCLTEYSKNQGIDDARIQNRELEANVNSNKFYKAAKNERDRNTDTQPLRTISKWGQFLSPTISQEESQSEEEQV